MKPYFLLLIQMTANEAVLATMTVIVNTATCIFYAAVHL